MAASLTLTLTPAELQVALLAIDHLTEGLDNKARRLALLRVRLKIVDALNPRKEVA